MHTCRIRNPIIAQAGRVEALGRTIGRVRTELSANRPVRLGNTSLEYSPGVVKTSLERISKSKDKRHPIKNNTVRCSLVRPTFVKNVEPDGILQKCPAESIIILRWNDYYEYC